MIKGQFEVDQPEKVVFTLTVSAELDYWRKVRKAFKAAQENNLVHYYCFQNFTNLIDDMIRKAEAEYSNSVAEEPAADESSRS